MLGMVLGLQQWTGPREPLAPRGPQCPLVGADWEQTLASETWLHLAQGDVTWEHMLGARESSRHGVPDLESPLGQSLKDG